MAAISYDTIVVGGGIIGCSIAWRLAQHGQKVAVVERGHVGGEASSAAAGVLNPKAAPTLSAQLLAFYATSMAQYPAYVDEIRAATGQAFEFRISGHLIPALSDEEAIDLRLTYELQEPSGIRAEWWSRDDTLALEPLLNPEVRAAIYYPDHGFVDNQKLSNAVGSAARAAGVDVFENCLVTGLAFEGESVVGVKTPGETFQADTVVNCAGSWSGLLDPRCPMPVRPLKGEIIAVDARPHSPHILVSGLSHSAVPRADGRTILCATSSDAGYNKDVVFGSVVGLFERVARLFPMLRTARFLDTWAGLRPLTPDREPVLGADPTIRGLYWATGHAGMGIVSAPATARALADLIVNGASSIPIGRFGPERFIPVKVGVN